jgi:hypothetical protein
LIVRKATVNDLSQVIELGKEFADISKPYHRLSIDDNKIENFSKLVINNDNFISLVLEDGLEIKGIFTAQITKTFFSDDIIAQELVWYVRQKTIEGLRLLFEFEKQCEEKKVNKIIVGCKKGFCDMTSIYYKRGYSSFESFFIKDLI